MWVVHTKALTWGSEDNFVELILSSPPQVGHSTSLILPQLLQKMTDVYWNFSRNPGGPTAYLTEATADCPAPLSLCHLHRSLA